MTDSARHETTVIPDPDPLVSLSEITPAQADHLLRQFADPGGALPHDRSRLLCCHALFLANQAVGVCCTRFITDRPSAVELQRICVPHAPLTAPLLRLWRECVMPQFGATMATAFQDRDNVFLAFLLQADGWEQVGLTYALTATGGKGPAAWLWRWPSRNKAQRVPFSHLPQQNPDLLP